MKIFQNLSLALAVLLLLNACKKTEHDPKVCEFKAVFYTALTPTDETGNCTEPFSFYNNQEGEGDGTYLGAFQARVAFCFNPATAEYIDGEGVFYAESGDELYYTITGQVIPSDDPDYNLMFQDPFTITGGTGIFEGATGEGQTNSYVRLLTDDEGTIIGDRTDHVWTGTIQFAE